jgi:hypothetical protein
MTDLVDTKSAPADQDVGLDIPEDMLVKNRVPLSPEQLAAVNKKIAESKAQTTNGSAAAPGPAEADHTAPVDETATEPPTVEPRVFKIHPAAALLPLMEGKDFDDLVADIKANGLKEPVTLLGGLLLDGRNRVRACIAAGVPVSVDEHQEGCPQIGNPYSYVGSKNIHRRHFTPEDRRKYFVELVAAQPEKSDRALAREAKVDHKQISRARRKAEATGAIAPVEKRVGNDGKARRHLPKKSTSAGRIKANQAALKRNQTVEPKVTTAGPASNAVEPVASVDAVKEAADAPPTEMQTAPPTPQAADTVSKVDDFDSDTSLSDELTKLIRRALNALHTQAPTKDQTALTYLGRANDALKRAGASVFDVRVYAEDRRRHPAANGKPVIEAEVQATAN